MPPRGHTPSYARRRTLILRTAARAFSRKGFHVTTVEDIAAELNVTKTTVYHYFRTKEHLVFEVQSLSIREVLYRLQQIREQFQSPVDQLRALVGQHLRVLAAYEGTFLLQNEYALPEEDRARLVALRDRYEAEVTRIVEAGIRERLFRVRDVRVTVHMMLGSLNWFLHWYSAESPLTVAQIGEAYADFLLHGLLDDGNALETAGPAPGAQGPVRRYRPVTRRGGMPIGPRQLA